MKPVALSLSLANTEAVHNHYMPFFKDGGLFIPTPLNIEFNTKVILQLKLQQEQKKLTIPGIVSWVAPVGVQRGIGQGIGIQFHGEHCNKIQRFFEELLGDLMNQPAMRPAF